MIASFGGNIIWLGRDMMNFLWVNIFWPDVYYINVFTKTYQTPQNGRFEHFNVYKLYFSKQVVNADKWPIRNTFYVYTS